MLMESKNHVLKEQVAACLLEHLHTNCGRMPHCHVEDGKVCFARYDEQGKLREYVLELYERVL